MNDIPAGAARERRESSMRPREPVFLAGMNGSGTTMLLDHRSNQSQLYGFPVTTRSLTYFVETEARYGDL
jgi:chromosomal replication initiation ATPase DnaA